MGLSQFFGIISKNKEPLWPSHVRIARECAAEGIVLLENDGTLPLQGRTVALFGAGAIDTITCGIGSGYVNSPYTVNVYEGLKNAGFAISSEGWLDKFRKQSRQANKKDKTLSLMDKLWEGKSILIEDLEITEDELAQAQKADTAIYVIRRNTGENYDRKAERGDYELSEQEEKNLRLLAGRFAHTVVVLNTCVIDAATIRQIPGVSAVVLMGLGGMEAGNALADVLTGAVCPSGKLTDTWAEAYADYPASATFSANDGQTLREEYREDIYVGYRYFDSFGKNVVYPFGYGLSYTTFAIETAEALVDWKEITIKIRVTNTGSVAGKEVVQVYASAPQDRLKQCWQELKAFGKTSLLPPGESETLTLRFPTEALASYDEQAAAYVMEAGDFLLRVGNSSRNTVISARIRLDRETTVRTLKSCCAPAEPLDSLTAPAFENAKNGGICLSLRSADCICVDGASKIKREIVTFVPDRSDYSPSERKESVVPWFAPERIKRVRAFPEASFFDVQSGKVSMEEFVASLPNEVLYRLVAGIGSETKHTVPSRVQDKKLRPVKAPRSSGQTTSQYVSALGIPNTYLTDGPAGLHIIGQAVTGYPVNMVQAQTWNTALLYRLGECFAEEMEAYNVTVILGPGMNIHRDPLCGRSFEYYAEDPVLTGLIAAAYTDGVQSRPGRGVSVKHFCCNSQETDRFTSDSVVSERALREIYLKGFEIAVKKAQPMTVMTSYNKLNGQHTSSRYDLITDILRGEWGFEGLVMTDWGTRSEKPLDILAGNDLIMGGARAELFRSAHTGAQPEFEPDGSVRDIHYKEYGLFRRTLSGWNSFAPDPDGADTLRVPIAEGKKPGKAVQEAVEARYATLQDNTVIYRGTERGAYLPLGALQACAIRNLRYLLASGMIEKL